MTPAPGISTFGGVPVHHVVIPIFAGFQSLDVTGPYEVLSGATTLLEGLDADSRSRTGYGVSLVAATPGPVMAESGLQLVADNRLPNAGQIGTLLVPGGCGARTRAPEQGQRAGAGSGTRVHRQPELIIGT